MRGIAGLSNRSVQLAVRQTVRHDIARLTSTFAAPAPVACALLLGVACSTARSLTDGVVLGALAGVCATVPATLYIERQLRRGGPRRQYLQRRSERLTPIAIACASVLLAGGLVRAVEPSRDLECVLLTMLFVLCLTLAATPISRVSVHMAAVTGTSVILQFLFGPIGVALLPVVAMVGWSRLELGEHTTAQVVTGAVLGAIGAIAAYSVVG